MDLQAVAIGGCGAVVANARVCIAEARFIKDATSKEESKPRRFSHSPRFLVPLGPFPHLRRVIRSGAGGRGTESGLDAGHHRLTKISVTGGTIIHHPICPGRWRKMRTRRTG
jgi:hypothetical protein